MCRWEKTVYITLFLLRKKNARCHWEAKGVSKNYGQNDLEWGTKSVSSALVFLSIFRGNLTYKGSFFSLVDFVEGIWTEVLPHLCLTANQLWTKGREVGIRKRTFEQGVLHHQLREENCVQCKEALKTGTCYFSLRLLVCKKWGLSYINANVHSSCRWQGVVTLRSKIAFRYFSKNKWTPA